MTKEMYENKRKALLDEAGKLIDDSKAQESQAKMDEVKALDAQWEDESKMRANLNAMNAPPAPADIGSSGVNADGTVVARLGSEAAPHDLYGSLEYKKEFMNYVLRGTPVSERFRNDVTKTPDVGVLIPTTTLGKIIEKLEAVGGILPLVTRTNYRGGLEIPVSTVKPVATWVAEGAGSEKQKKTIGKVTFTNHKLRCAIAVSLEVDNMALPVFESAFINNVTEAMIKAAEQGIISGTGNGQNSGILMETPEEGQALDATGKITDIEKAEAALPSSYETGAVWCMTKKTFMHYATLKDSNGQPVGRTNYGGVVNKPERLLLGRQVVLCDYLPNYSDTAVAEDTVFAFLFNFKDYVLNTSYTMTVKRYEDNETDDQVTKAIMVMDGKVVDKHSLVTLTQKA